jgi:PAS domain S-box-containing protein
LLKQYIEAIEKNNIVSKTDINGIITFANEEFCKISKYSQDELIGKNHNIVRHPDVPPEAFKKLWDTILAKKTYKATVKNMAKDGSTFYVNTTVIPILDEDDNIVEFVAIRYDVTEAVMTAKELEKKEKELESLNATLEERIKKQTLKLEELNKNLEIRVQKEVKKNREKDRIMFQQARFAAMGEMIANIAHQWRQPLSELGILLFKIKNAFLNHDIREFDKDYNDCKTVINAMSKTIDDFRDFFKPSREKNDFFIEDTIEEAIFIIKETLKSHNIKINFNNKHSIILNGHSNEILQVVLNIINNAKDVLISKKQKIKKIDIKVSKTDKKIQVSICDNGGGIKEEIIDKIFDPYFTTKHSKQGTGIGLYMSKKIIEENSGTIDVINTKEGACFIIKLPLGQDDI